MNALANEEVGKLLDRYFVSTFQRVGTFRIANGQKQGGNVAAYFCAPDGRVLHAIAGPVDAESILREANWIVETAKEAGASSNGDGTRFKQLLRKAHARRLQEQYGFRVTPVFEDYGRQSLNDAAATRDKQGRRLAPVLSLPPIEGQSAVGNQPNNAAKVHQLLAAHAALKIEELFGAVFEGILGEKVTTRPVQTDRPFSWLK